MMVSEQELEELAAELGVPFDEDVEVAVGSFANELSTFVEKWDEERSDLSSRGAWSTDEYNALLDIYEIPRQRRSEGKLDELSFVVKDNIAVDGLTMTCGSKSLATVPDYDATVVKRILEAGGQLIGKANMDAFAFGPGGMWSEFGRVKNPLSEDRIPGGTSSGSGVAVATGLADAALGSDTGGSIRSPAACCGIVGIKPTHKLVPRYGLVENVPSADTIGPLARDVETAARVLEVIRGPDRRDPTTSAVAVSSLDSNLDQYGEIEFGVLELEGHGVTESVTEAIEALTATLCERDTCRCKWVELDMEDIEKAYSVISGAETSWLLRQSFAQRGGVPHHPEMTAALAESSFNDHITKRILPGAYLDAVTNGRAYALAQEQVVAFKQQLAELFGDIDVLLTPTLRSLPPRYEQMQTEGGFKYTIAKQFSLAGLPAVSVPFAERDGLPISAQILAPEFEDKAAIKGAHLVEQITANA